MALRLYDYIRKLYRIAGYFRGVHISRISKLLQLAELIFMKLIENHTHVPSVATLQVQSLRKFSFREIHEIYTRPRK